VITPHVVFTSISLFNIQSQSSMAEYSYNLREHRPRITCLFSHLCRADGTKVLIVTDE